MEGVVGVVITGRLAQQLGEKIAPGAAHVQIEAAGAHVGDEHGHAARNRGGRFGGGVFGGRAVNADVGVCVNGPGKAQQTCGIVNGRCRLSLYLCSNPRKFTIFEAHVLPHNALPVGAHHAYIFNHKVQLFVIRHAPLLWKL